MEPQKGETIVVWFSCGAASAVAAKKTIERYGDICNIRVVNNPIAEEDEDNRRFLKDVEKWLGVEVELAINPKWPNCSAVEVWEKRKYMSGTAGAPCTGELKKKARQHWESNNHADWMVMGFTMEEEDRHNRFNLSERDNVLPILIQERISKAHCYQILFEAGIRVPRVYHRGYPNANCFTAEMRFLTKEGIVSFGDVVGRTVKVRAKGKGTPWRDAEVKSFGKQPVVEVVLRRGPNEKIIRTTAKHRWFVGTRNHHTERTTENLTVGDRLVPAHAQIHSRASPSPWGIARGITFGDGSVHGTTAGSCARLVLCGDKGKSLLQYFPLSPRKQISTGIEVTGLPRDWKELPSLDMDDSFLFGWLAGYFAADGCASTRGDYSISSTRHAHVEHASNIAVRLGISVGQIRRAERVCFGKPSTLYSLPLVGATLKEEFFLNEEHRRRFVASNPREPHPWFVKDVRYTNQTEDVFCVVEPVSKTFVLEDNILTGNCLGCVKATSPTYWNHVRKVHPDVFEARAEQSRRLGVRLVKVPPKKQPWLYWDETGWVDKRTGEQLYSFGVNDDGQEMVIDHAPTRIFLDELPLDVQGRPMKNMDFECGLFCEELK